MLVYVIDELVVAQYYIIYCDPVLDHSIVWFVTLLAESLFLDVPNNCSAGNEC